MQEIIHDELRQAVREWYSRVAESSATDCGCSTSCCDGEREPEPTKVEESIDSGCGCTTGCCSGESPTTVEEASVALGYSQEEVASVPEGANMGLGCGNPQAIASLTAGETALDLGSGGGFDSFLAARQVAPSGQVIGVDMTAKMIAKARKNALRAGVSSVEFRLGEIERLPLADDLVDVIISNCVINLSPEKERVFQEAFRVLKRGGRLAISDIVATAELPEEARSDLALYTGCITGAALIDNLQRMLSDAGFIQITIKPKDESKSFMLEWVPGHKIEDYVVSATIEAMKP